NVPSGQYQLFFDANAANTIGDMNANDERSLDLISVPPSSQSAQDQSLPITNQNFTINSNTATVPEFGSTSFLILIVSIVSVLVFAKSQLNASLFS
ncbi:MAG: PEFG-CTERM sorting domain-containing protein, partial [Nitrosotalea sp.]